MERLNLDCSFDGCKDRQKSWELQRKVAELTLEKNELFSQVENIKNTLKDNKESITKVFKELLVGVKVVDGKKVLDMEELDKKLIEVAVKMDDDKISEIVHTNLELQNKLHDVEMKALSFEQLGKEKDERLKALEMEKAVRQEKDVQLIRNTSKAQSQMVDLVKQKDDLAMDVLKLENHKKAIQADIDGARREADTIYKKYEEASKGMTEIRENVEFLKKEFAFQQKFLPFKIRWFVLPRIKAGISAFESGKVNLAKKKWVKAQVDYIKLNESEKRLIAREYDKLMKIMDGVK